MVTLKDIAKIQVSVAHGKASFNMEKGSFDYTDEVTFKTQLIQNDVKLTKKEFSARYTTPNGETAGFITASFDSSKNALEIQTKFISPETNRVNLTFPSEESHYYGCGETFSEFDLSGERVRIWVAEHQNLKRIEKKTDDSPVQSLDHYESYYVQPTFITKSHYYLHIDGKNYMEFDFRIPKEFTIQLREDATIKIAGANSFEELSKKLSDQLGRQKELPDWIYDGIILGIQRGYDEVQAKIEQAKKHGVSVCGVWCQDWCGCRKTQFGYQVMWNWEADETLYNGLKERIKKWKEDGIHFLGYINPFLALEKPLYAYASSHGYCVKKSDGSDYLVTITTFPAAMIDLTNSEAWKWYKSVIKHNLIEIGMDGWMADFGEYLPVDAVLSNKVPAKIMHNQWPALWAKLNQEAVQESGRENEIFFFTRAGFTETIKYSAMMWNGDQHVDWSFDDGLPSVIPASLSLSMSGFGLVHSDVGGYTTNERLHRSKELFIRWAEMNAFSILMRTHEGNQPWNNVQFDADEEIWAELKKSVELHKRLKPYLKKCVSECAKTGVPVMRPIFYHYDEEGAYCEKYEYLLGRDILIAPDLQKEETVRQVYLPKHKWIHL